MAPAAEEVGVKLLCGCQRLFLVGARANGVMPGLAGMHIYCHHHGWTLEVTEEVPLPYHVEKSNRCPTSKPFAVLKEGGEIMGCHESEGSAHRQLKALYVAEQEKVKAEQWQEAMEIVVADDWSEADG